MLDSLISILFIIFLILVLCLVGAAVIFILSLLAKSLSSEDKDKQDKYELKLVDLKRESFEQQHELSKKLELLGLDEVERKKKEKLSESKKGQKALEESYAAFLKQQQEQIKVLEEQGLSCPEHLFVISFDGDTRAHEVEQLRREINYIIAVAKEHDEVILRLTSPGGVVNGYGLCASQLMRLRDKNINLTVCVDTVAASGGYMMAAVANKIVAAPFAYVGSIGVIAALPNFNRFLDEHKVDYEQITAGKYKRTLTMFGKNTAEAREKLQQELELIHERFKQEIKQYRPQFNIDEFATGEHWLAQDALERGLVDEIQCSDTYIQSALEKTKLSAVSLEVTHKEKKSLMQRVFKLLKAKTWVKATLKQTQRLGSQDNITIK